MRTKRVSERLRQHCGICEKVAHVVWKICRSKIDVWWLLIGKSVRTQTNYFYSVIEALTAVELSGWGVFAMFVGWSLWLSAHAQIVTTSQEKLKSRARPGYPFFKSTHAKITGRKIMPAASGRLISLFLITIDSILLSLPELRFR